MKQYERRGFLPTKSVVLKGDGSVKYGSCTSKRVWAGRGGRLRTFSNDGAKRTITAKSTASVAPADRSRGFRLVSSTPGASGH